MKQQTLQRQLETLQRSERRECGECGYNVENPFCEKCPRCNSLLPKLQLHCTGCAVSSVCPSLKVHAGGESSHKADPGSGIRHSTAE